jgi:hypothetical protein
MKNSFFFSILLALSACISSSRTKVVDYTGFFTDSNSKVWIISSYHQENEEYFENDLISADLLIFYADGSYAETTIQDLAQRKFKKGRFYLNSEEETIELVSENEKSIFSFDIDDDGTLIFEPLGNTKFGFKAIPFPHLN